MRGRGIPADIEGRKAYIQGRVKVTEAGCWEWVGSNDGHGYGTFSTEASGRRISMRAHRAAYEVWVGPIANGLVICHHCDNPPCCNPDHLFMGTKADNNRDKLYKGRHRTGRLGARKVSPSAVEAIRILVESGKFTNHLIGTWFALSDAQIHRIATRKNWASV